MDGGACLAALKTAEKIKNDYYRAGTLTAIAGAQAVAGDGVAARTTINLALATAEKINADYYHPVALTSIAEAQAKMGDVAGAQATAEKIKDAYHRARALTAIGRIQERLCVVRTIGTDSGVI